MKKIVPIIVAVALVASLLAASCAPEKEEEASGFPLKSGVTTLTRSYWV